MKYSKDKNINLTVKQLVKDGWEFKWGGKHGRIKHPRGYPTITVPKSPSDRRSSLNFHQDIKKVFNLNG